MMGSGASLSQTLDSDDERAPSPAFRNPRPRVFLLLECDRPTASSSRHELGDLDQVVIGRGRDRMVSRTAEAPRVLSIGIPDAHMSRVHARLVKELDRWVVEDAGSRNGVVLNGVRCERAILGDGDLFELGHTFFLYRDTPEPSDFSVAPDCDATQLAPPAPGLSTFLPGLQNAFGDLARVTQTTVPVLVHGETGTGKELLARAVHDLAGREGPFVAINCGALPGTLVESELFGYRKGAFSGANQDRIGLVRSAERGTLFLDEIGDLSLSSQAALLRVLQEREVLPLGSSQPVGVDIQVVAATHHDLDALVARDQFRRDLLGRISGFMVRLPPLRERREDLGLLIAALIWRAVPDRPDAVKLHPDAARALVRHEWPLNVRELEAALQVATALAGDQPIRIEHLPEAVRSAPRPAEGGGTPGAPPLSPADVRRRDELIELLREHHGNVSAVARATGKARIQIQRWLRRYRLDPTAFRQ